MNCKKCGADMQVYGGCSAHEDNWYCPSCPDDPESQPSLASQLEARGYTPHHLAEDYFNESCHSDPGGARPANAVALAKRNAEIERLMGLVESAYMEGFETGYFAITTPASRHDWMNSKARRELYKESGDE